MKVVTESPGSEINGARVWREGSLINGAVLLPISKPKLNSACGIQISTLARAASGERTNERARRTQKLLAD